VIREDGVRNVVPSVSVIVMSVVYTVTTAREYRVSGNFPFGSDLTTRCGHIILSVTDK